MIRKKAFWTGNYEEGFVCSRCEEDGLFESGMLGDAVDSNYCPSCGAKMTHTVEDNDEEDEED